MSSSLVDNLNQLHLSTDSGDPPPSNGHTKQPNTQHGEDDPSLDPVERLQKELERTRQEKDAFESQYNGLVAKLTTMRMTLGNKLKQDAEELDRREQTIQQLTSTVEVFQEELTTITSKSDALSDQLTTVTLTLQDTQEELSSREHELRETELQLERHQIEQEDWRQAALQDKALAEEARIQLDSARRELEAITEARQKELKELGVEKEKSSNLDMVLRDFQAAKDHEIRQAVKDYDSRLMQATQSLAEFKHRALTAELQLEELTANISRTKELEKEVKEKTLLIGKLRHEGVILNEHLMEALRRLRRNSSETNVDRRLVTNILLQFLTTPRADAKRFEMLNLLSTILGWTDSEKERAGLQRSSSASATPTREYGSGGLFWGRSSGSNNNTPQAKTVELEKSDETESFSRLWVEFLLTEANGSSPPGPTSSPPSTTPPATLPAITLNTPNSIHAHSALPPISTSAPSPAGRELSPLNPTRKLSTIGPGNVFAGNPGHVLGTMGGTGQSALFSTSAGGVKGKGKGKEKAVD